MNNLKFKIKHSKLLYASLKDLARKVFAFSKFEDDALELLTKVDTILKGDKI